MAKIDITSVLRRNINDCPVKGFPFYLMDAKRDEWDIERYFLTMYAEDYHAPRYTTEQRIQLAFWIRDVLLPELNNVAPVFLDVRDSGDVFE